MTYWGGNAADNISALALDASGDIYAAGFTLSGNFPLLGSLPDRKYWKLRGIVTKQKFVSASLSNLAAGKAGYAEQYLWTVNRCCVGGRRQYQRKLPGRFGDRYESGGKPVVAA